MNIQKSIFVNYMYISVNVSRIFGECLHRRKSST